MNNNQARNGYILARPKGRMSYQDCDQRLYPHERRAWPVVKGVCSCGRRVTASRRPAAVLHPTISPQLLSFWKPHMGARGPGGFLTNPSATLCQGLAIQSAYLERGGFPSWWEGQKRNGVSLYRGGSKLSRRKQARTWRKRESLIIMNLLELSQETLGFS